MKAAFGTFVLLFSVNSFGLGSYAKSINDSAAKAGFKRMTNFCQMTVNGGQGAKGPLEMEVREFTDAKGKSISVASYMINETADEHYGYTVTMPVKIGAAMKSSAVDSIVVEKLLEKPKQVSKSHRKGALLDSLLILSDDKSESALKISKVALNKETISYNVNSDTYVECDSELELK